MVEWYSPASVTPRSDECTHLLWVIMPPQCRRRRSAFAIARSDKSAGVSFRAKLSLCTGRSGPHLIHGSLGPPRVHNRNGISIGSAVFAGLTTVTDRQTDHATRSVTIGRIYVHSTVMWSRNEVQQAALFKHQTLMLHFSKSFDNLSSVRSYKRIDCYDLASAVKTTVTNNTFSNMNILFTPHVYCQSSKTLVD